MCPSSTTVSLKQGNMSRTQGSVSRKQDSVSRKRESSQVCLGSVSRKQESVAYAEGVEFAVLPELLALVPVERECLARITVCL